MPTESPPGLSNLYGVVRDKSTGTVLAGVFVQVYSDVGQTSLTTTTDSSGYFLFENLTPGGFQLMCEKEGYDTFSQTGILTEGNNQLNPEMIPVATPPGNGQAVTVNLTKEAVCASGAMIDGEWVCYEYFPDEREVKLTVTNQGIATQLIIILEGYMYLDGVLHSTLFSEKVWQNAFESGQSRNYSEEYVIPISGMNLNSHFFVTVTDGSGNTLIDRQEFVSSL